MIHGRIVKFKINPGLYNPHLTEAKYHKHYYMVHVFENEPYMWKYGTKLRPYQSEGYQAIVLPKWKQKGDLIVSAKIGDVLLNKDWLGTRVISHEAAHIATSFLRILKLLKLTEQIDENEERLAYCIGQCNSAIVTGLYKYDLY